MSDNLTYREATDAEKKLIIQKKNKEFKYGYATFAIVFILIVITVVFGYMSFKDGVTWYGILGMVCFAMLILFCILKGRRLLHVPTKLCEVKIAGETIKDKDGGRLNRYREYTEYCLILSSLDDKVQFKYYLSEQQYNDAKKAKKLLFLEESISLDSLLMIK